ncbi:hypothetical protein [Catellatospora sp. NPDC049609]|uniref:hypothetical protein n=1 Tax=Catellatospora sp. NPDC049609 TaxID=3155505 RepID=UPI00341B3806
MTIIAEPMHARPRSPEHLAGLFAGGWPEFIFHDQQTKRHIGRIRDLFGDLELVLLDDGVPVAAGWAVPLCWNGETDDLPAGYNDSLARALADHDAGRTPDTHAVLAAQVHPGRQGEGLAARLLTALCDDAASRGRGRVICPVRPTHKSRYPLTPIERYQHWTRPDGLPFDPWLRTHVRMGARILAAAPRSQVITGTVAQWQTWTGLTFPDSGDYVIPDGLSPLHIDHRTDTGTYAEPNTWLRHR